MGFSRQEYWIGLPFSSPGDVPHPGIKPAPPASAGRFSTTDPTGKPYSLKLTPQKKKILNPTTGRLFASSCPPNAQRFWDVLFFFLNTFLFLHQPYIFIAKDEPITTQVPRKSTSLDSISAEHQCCFQKPHGHHHVNAANPQLTIPKLTSISSSFSTS